MGHIKRVDDSIEVIRGGGLAALLGLASLAAGIGAGFAAVNTRNYALLIPTALFGLPGFILLLGRFGTRIMQPRHSILRWYGLIVPMYRTEYPLDEFTHVELSRAKTSQDSGTIVYPVSLPRPKQQIADDVFVNKDLIVQAQGNYLLARRLAEDIARLLRMDLHDRTSNDVAIRHPDELDLSLRERLLARGVEAHLPPAPDNQKVRVTTDGETMTFNLPRLGFLPVHSLVIVLSMGFFVMAGMFGLAFATNSNSSGANIVAAFFGCIGLIPVIMSFAISHKVANTLETLSVSEHGDLSLTRTYLSRGKTKSIPSINLEELLVDHPQKQPPIGVALPRIYARSDSLSWEFGTSVSAEELDWMVAVIKYRIASL